ncbi:MAG: LysM peptidoglycan-binding domain-containing protein [Bacteroidales bacterium]
MMRKRHANIETRFLLSVLLISVYTFFFTSENCATAQVVVEKSKDKVIISGVPYYIHIVKKGETAYSISKAYGVTVDELARLNPDASIVLKEGQVLRIPVVETQGGISQPKTAASEQKRDETKFFYHKLRPGDTIYSLAKNYGVSVDDIIRSNPGTDINKLPVGSEIAIPRRDLITTPKTIEEPDKEYMEHRVAKGESLASIAEKYEISVRELRRENRGIIFPRVDEIIKIPVYRINEQVPADNVKTDTLKAETEIPEFEIPSEITPVRNLRGKFNVAVLLPFFTYENAIRSEIDSSQVIKGKTVYRIVKRPEYWLYPSSIPFIELYQGILVAADTLRSMGLEINIYTYDTSIDSSDIVSLISSDRLKKMDLIIGPVYTDELLQIAEYSKENKIPVVSPVPLRNNMLLKDDPYLFMAIPSVEVAQQSIAKRARLFKNSNFVFIHNDSTRSNPLIINFRNLLLREIGSATDYDSIKFKELLFISRSALPTDSINRLEQALSPMEENVVIIASENYSVLSETIIDLHTLSRKYNIRLLGYPAVRELVNLDPKLYFDLGIELYSYYWIDYKQPDVISFLKTYRKKYLSEPPETSYVWQGYDIIYYFLSGLAIHGKQFINRPSIHNPDLLETRFYFRQKTRNDGFENNHLYLLKYIQNMEIVVLKEEWQNP